jgi:ABC-type proline/glycine betaine transport system ATPase subunit
MRRSRIPLLFINSQLMPGRQVLEVDSYGEEVSYEANCNENQI